MNKTKIEMFVPNGYQWSPLKVRCKRGCRYCWTQRAKYSYLPKEPKWDEKELYAPERLKKHTDILVCWTTDLMLMGTDTQIKRIIDVAHECLYNETLPTHRFFFLTKSPEMYEEFNFPENCWLGVTINNSNKIAEAQHEAENWQSIKIYHREHPKQKLFLSIEPIYGWTIKEFLPLFNWIFVGCETVGSANRSNLKTLPKKEWLLDIRETCQRYGIPLWEKKVLKTAGLLPELVQQKAEE